MRMLPDTGTDLEATKPRGETLLILLSIHDRRDQVAELIERGASVMRETRGGALSVETAALSPRRGRSMEGSCHRTTPSLTV